MSFKPYAAKFNVYSSTKDSNLVKDFKQPKIATAAVQLAYEKILVKESKPKVIDDEIVAPSENLDSSGIFKAIFKKGVNPYRPEIVFMSEYQPISTGNFSDHDANSINLNFGNNKLLEMTNVARLIELQHILKKNAILYSNSLIARYGNVKLSSRRLINEMERYLRRRKNFSKVYSKNNNTFRLNLINAVKNNTRNKNLSKRIESADSLFLNLCAGYVLNKYVAREITLYVARLFDYKEKIEKSIELSSNPRIKPARRSTPKITMNFSKKTGAKQPITVKNLFGPGMANFRRNAISSFSSAMGAVARKNSQNNLSRSNFENFVDLVSHLNSLVFCFDTIKDLDETNFEIKNTISYGREGNLKNSLDLLRKIKFAGCFSEDNVLQSYSGNTEVTGQSIQNIIEQTATGTGAENVAEILAAICFDQVMGANFRVNQEFEKIQTLAGNFRVSMRRFLSENFFPATPGSGMNNKKFTDFKNETTQHGVLLKKLFDKRSFENKDYIPYETNNTMASNVYSENDAFPGEEIYFTSAIKKNDRKFLELKNFAEDLKNSFESVSQNLINAMSLGFDEDGKFIDSRTGVIDNLNPITYLNVHLKTLGDELTKGFTGHVNVKKHLPGLAICVASAGNYDALADVYCASLMGTLLQEKAVPFWANDTWMSKNIPNFTKNKASNIYSTIMSECKYRTSNSLKVIFENLDVDSYLRGTERFGRTNIPFDTYLLNDTKIASDWPSSGHRFFNIGIGVDNHFDPMSGQEFPEQPMSVIAYGTNSTAPDKLKSHMNLENSTDSYPYNSQTVYTSLSVNSIDTSLNGSIGNQDAAGCQFTKNGTYMSRVIFNSSLGEIGDISSDLILPGITSDSSIALSNYSNSHFFNNGAEDNPESWTYNQYPSFVGDYSKTSSVQRGLIFFLFANGLLAGTQRMRAIFYGSEFRLAIKGSRMKALIRALKGQDISPNATDSHKHAYQEALERINLVKGKILKRQDYILRCLAVLSDKIEGLLSVYKNLSNFVEGNTSDKNFQFVKDKLESFDFFDNTFGLLNASFKDHLAKGFVKNYGYIGGYFPSAEKIETNDIKIMNKLFSQPGFGFLQKEKFGRKNIFNVGIPLGMMDYLKREAYKETGDEDYLDSSIVVITVYKNNQISSGTKYLPKQFVFDMSKHILPYYCSYNGQIRRCKHVRRMSDDASFAKILKNIEVLVFNDSSNFGFKSNGIGTDGIVGNRTSDTVNNYENNLAFKNDVLFNHFVDYYLKLYTQLSTGIEIDESALLIQSENIFTGNVDNKSAENYKNRIIQNLLSQYPDIAENEKTRETFFRAANSLNNSFLLSSNNRLKEMLTMPCFERVFSIFINERDFLLDDEDANEIFETSPAINRTCKLQRNFINAFNASRINNKFVKNYIKEMNDKHVTMSGFSIDVGILKKW